MKRVIDRVRVASDCALIAAPVLAMPHRAPTPPDDLPAAERSAAAIVAAAQQDAQSLREAASRQGLALGMQQARDEVRAAAERFAALADALAAEHAALLRAAEPQLVALAVDIAREILHAELVLRPEAVAGAVAAALDGVTPGAPVRVALHPDDLDLVTDQGPVLPGEVQFSADPSLARGDCSVHSSTGFVDGRLETRLSEMRRHLLEEASYDGA